MEEMTEARLALKRKFMEHLEAVDYMKRLREEVIHEKKVGSGILELARTRVLLDTHDIRQHDPSLLRDLLNQPADALPSLEEAIKDVADEDVTKLLQETDTRLTVGLDGDFGRNTVSPRDLTCKFLGKLVKVYGIVIRASIVRPKVVKSVHFCEATKLYSTKEYRDVTSYSGLPTGAAYPTRDDNSNLLVTEYGLCKYRDHQVLTLQELPETAPAGQMPHSVEVLVENDLVDSCKPGDRIGVVGIYRAVSPKAGGPASGVFRAVLIANHVERLSHLGVHFWTDQESRVFAQELSRVSNLLDLMATSLAPSIHGHHMVKRGLVLMLVGGQEKNLDTGTHLRGDINCMLVGDPGVAKSQLLRAVMKVAPHAVSTSGRGSSGVGLTAAVATDSETGEKRLEAGAMVLADRGVVCIDEFDKMSDVDRVAIHEVMEQQTVTIAKAGIHTSLNARCSVFAAANPLYGTYEPNIPITKNINLPDSLLSRFDLLFIVRDHIDGNRDREIAGHVLGQHRYRQQWDDGRTLPVQDVAQDSRPQDNEEVTSMTECFMRYDARLHGPKTPGRIEPLKTSVLRKYIAMLRSRYTEEGKPVALNITDEAMDEMTDYFASLRQNQVDRALPVTARTLETIIRLSTAHAKLCMKTEVDPEDVGVAKELMDYVMKSETSGGDLPPNGNADASGRHAGRKRSSNRGNIRDDGDADDDDDDNDGGDDAAPPLPSITEKRSAAAQRSTSQAPQSTRNTRRSAQAAASAAATQPSTSQPAAAGPSQAAALPADGPAKKARVNRKLEACILQFVKGIPENVGETKPLAELFEFVAAQGINAAEAAIVEVAEKLSNEHKTGITDYPEFFVDKDDWTVLRM